MPPQLPPGETVRTLPGKTVAYEAITVAATAIGLTAANVTLCDSEGWAVLTLNTAQIRFNTDGSTPTASVGYPMEAGQSLTIRGLADLTRFLAIRTTGTSGTLYVAYFNY